jgi:hypothetical protein
MVAGQTWTITVQSQFTGYNGFLDSPQVSNMPASQNAKNYPNGCVFAMNTAFQNWIADQPGWAKWLEGVVGTAALIGLTFLTFGAPEEVGAVLAADAAEGAAEAGVDDSIAAAAEEAGWEGGWENGNVNNIRGWRGVGQGWLGAEYGAYVPTDWAPII